MAKKDLSQAAEKVAKAEKASKARRPSSGKGNVLARAGKSIPKFLKDFKAELKKIVWPDRKTVIKSTGVVLSVVAVIGLIIFLIDTGLTEAIQLLSKAASNFNAEKASALAEATQPVTEALTEAVTQAVTEALTEATTIVGG